MGGKVLITGGLGYLGSWISTYLCNSGYDVYILSRQEKYKLKDINYTLIECDITNLEDLDKKLNFDIDYCIHTASYNEYFLPNYSKKALEVNTLGTRNLLEVLSKKYLKNFIYFSTFHVYGASSGIVKEETSLMPKNDYASTHLFAEYYVRQFNFITNLKYTILRLTNCYGAPMHKDSDKWYLVLNDFTKSAYDNSKIVIKSNGKASRDFIYIGDVANIIDKLLNMDATNEVYNLSSNISYEIIDIANIVKSVYERRYDKTIKIEINSNDKNIYKDIVVKNDKLKTIIDFTVNNMLSNEVDGIFRLLEGN